MTKRFLRVKKVKRTHRPRQDPGTKPSSSNRNNRLARCQQERFEQYRSSYRIALQHGREAINTAGRNGRRPIGMIMVRLSNPAQLKNGGIHPLAFVRRLLVDDRDDRNTAAAVTDC